MKNVSTSCKNHVKNYLTNLSRSFLLIQFIDEETKLAGD